MNAKKLYDALVTNVTASINDTARIVKQYVAVAYLDNDSKRDFMAEFKNLTHGQIAWNTAENYAGRAWKCLGARGIALANIWQQGQGPSISEIYNTLPKKQTGRKRTTAMQKVCNAFAKLPLDDKEEALGKMAEMYENHKNYAAVVEKQTAEYATAAGAEII